MVSPTPGPKSQTVRRHNEARLELEECIRSLDSPRNQDTNVDKETEPQHKDVEPTTADLTDQSRTRDPRPSSKGDGFYVDALLELENLDFSTT